MADAGGEVLMLDLEAIRRRMEAYQHVPPELVGYGYAHEYGRDVPALVAEVERLRDVIAGLVEAPDGPLSRERLG